MQPINPIPDKTVLNPESLKSDIHNAVGNVEKSVVNSNLKDELVEGFKKDLLSFKDDLSKLIDDFDNKLSDSGNQKSKEDVVTAPETPAEPETSNAKPADTNSDKSLKEESIVSDADLS